MSYLNCRWPGLWCRHHCLWHNLRNLMQSSDIPSLKTVAVEKNKHGKLEWRYTKQWWNSKMNGGATKAVQAATMATVDWSSIGKTGPTETMKKTYCNETITNAGTTNAATIETAKQKVNSDNHQQRTTTPTTTVLLFLQRLLFLQPLQQKRPQTSLILMALALLLELCFELFAQICLKSGRLRMLGLLTSQVQKVEVSALDLQSLRLKRRELSLNDVDIKQRNIQEHSAMTMFLCLVLESCKDSISHSSFICRKLDLVQAPWRQSWQRFSWRFWAPVGCFVLSQPKGPSPWSPSAGQLICCSFVMSETQTPEKRWHGYTWMAFSGATPSLFGSFNSKSNLGKNNLSNDVIISMGKIILDEICTQHIYLAGGENIHRHEFFRWRAEKRLPWSMRRAFGWLWGSSWLVEWLR